VIISENYLTRLVEMYSVINMVPRHGEQMFSALQEK